MTPEEREAKTQSMRTFMTEVQKLQAEGKKDDPLTQRYVTAIRKIGDELKVEAVPDAMSAGLGFSQMATGSLGDEISAGARAMMPESVVDPAARAAGEKFFDKPVDDYGVFGHTPLGKVMSMLKDDDEPSFSERYAAHRKEMYGDRPTPTEELPFMERYNAFLERNRNLNRQARSEDPGMMFGGEMAGAIPMAGAGLTKFGVQKGASMMQNLPRLMGIGGTEGAVYGYGSSEGDPLAAQLSGAPPEVQQQESAQALKDTMMGMGTGATVAGLVPGAATLGRKGLQQLIPKQRRIDEAARKSIAEPLELDIERGAMDMTEAQKMLDVPEMTVADVSRATREAAADVAATPTRGGEALRKFYENRNITSSQRIREQLTNTLSEDTDDLAAATLSFTKDIGRKADEAYTAAYKLPIQMTGNMRQLLQTPFGKKALRQAQITRSNRGKNPEGLSVKGQMQSMTDMDEVLREMNNQVDRAFKKGKGNPSQLKEMRDRFENMLYSQNDLYRTARTQYGTDMSRARALEYGQDIFKKKQLPEYVKQDLARMGDGDQEMLRLGVLEAAARELGGKQRTADAMKGVWNREGTKEVLQMVFPDQKTFGQFWDHVNANQEMFKTWQKVQRGAERGGGNEAKGWLARTVEMLGYTGGLQTGTGTARAGGAAGEEIGKALSTKGVTQAEKDLAASQAQLLMSKDLQGIMQPKTMGGLLSTDVPIAGGTMPAGGLLTSPLLQGEEYGR